MNTRKSPLLALWLSLLPGSTALAQDLLHGANIEAVGGASVAHVSDNATITTNPSMLALSERYDFAGALFGQLDGDLGWNLNAADSTKGRVGFGAGWTRHVVNPPLTDDELPGWTAPGVTPTNRRTTSVFSVGLAFAPGDRKVSFGLGGSIGSVSHDRLGKQLSADMTVGIGVHPSDVATVGLSVQGLLPVDGPENIPVRIIGGTRYALEDGPSVTLDMGWQVQDANGLGFVTNLGAEAAIGMARPRMGFSYDGPDRQATLTGGIGADNPAGALDAAMLIPLGPGFSGKHIRGVLTVRIRT